MDETCCVNGVLLTWPAKLHKLHGRLSSLLISDNDSSPDTQVPVPPCRIQPPGIGSNTQLDIAVAAGLRADGLESRRQSINMSRNHGNSISGFVCLANGECDDGAAIAGRVVLPPGLELAYPAIAAWELVVKTQC